MKNYELIEHTADVGIRVRGGDLPELFVNAALAMFDIAAGIQNAHAKPQTSISIRLNAEDTEELFVNWLNELLSLSATKELVFSDFKIDKLTDNLIEARVSGSDISNFKINTEIKAATYCQLKVSKIDSGWMAEVIFDV